MVLKNIGSNPIIYQIIKQKNKFNLIIFFFLFNINNLKNKYENKKKIFYFLNNKTNNFKLYIHFLKIFISKNILYKININLINFFKLYNFYKKILIIKYLLFNNFKIIYNIYNYFNFFIFNFKQINYLKKKRNIKKKIKKKVIYTNY